MRVDERRSARGFESTISRRYPLFLRRWFLIPPREEPLLPSPTESFVRQLQLCVRVRAGRYPRAEFSFIARRHDPPDETDRVSFGFDVHRRSSTNDERQENTFPTLTSIKDRGDLTYKSRRGSSGSSRAWTPFAHLAPCAGKETGGRGGGRRMRRGPRRRTRKKAIERKSVSRVLALGFFRLGGGKFNFDPVDSAVIPKFNL